MHEQSDTGYWLSPQQKQLCAIRTDPSQSSGRAVCLVSIGGPLRVGTLRQGIRDLIARHEILRTVFKRPVGMKLPFQIVLPSQEPAWTVLDRRHVEAADRKRELYTLFDGERSRQPDLEVAPVLHATLVQFRNDESALLLGLPAICADSRSLTVLVQELGELY